MARFLIIDDDRFVGKMLSKKITRMGHEASWSDTLQKGVDSTFRSPYDVVLLDVGMPDGNGIDALPRILNSPYHPEVIVMSGLANARDAEAAIQNGAWDYVQKEDLQDKYAQLLQYTLHYRQQNHTSTRTGLNLNAEGIVGAGEALRACCQIVSKAAQSNANVLISGATGTGKELFARAIHNNSDRRKDNMVVVDCAALPETLVESILFGSVKGIYTGADRNREGLVAQAHGGTLFLDEVAEMPLSTQKVFLRVLQERNYRPVGGHRELPSDFRLIAATNRNLGDRVADGLFREDLLYRLRAIQLNLPPLKARPDDIEDLARHFVDKICQRMGMAPKELSPDFMDALLLYDWPGNVREMVNAIETAVASACHHHKLFTRHLPDAIRLHVVRRTLPRNSQALNTMAIRPFVNSREKIPSLKEYRKVAAANAEKEYLRTLLLQTRNDIQAALQVSKLSRSRFYELLKEHNLTAPGAV
jgi:two-component system, NtrC family, response regulator